MEPLTEEACYLSISLHTILYARWDLNPGLQILKRKQRKDLGHFLHLPIAPIVAIHLILIFRILLHTLHFHLSRVLRYIPMSFLVYT